jgi:hypothetical protein
MARWNLQTGVLDEFPGTVAAAVNASGWLVSGNGTVIGDGGPVDLPHDEKNERVAKDVADNNLVVGFVSAPPSDKSQPMLWQC